MIGKITARFPGTRVLVVDDNQINQEPTQEMLEIMECEVDIAESGSDAIEFYQKSTYDIIFLDVQMPFKDGFEVTRQIREYETASTTHTPIVALTAMAIAGDKEKCIAAGMDDYISKPLRSSDLSTAIEKHVIGTKSL